MNAAAGRGLDRRAPVWAVLAAAFVLLAWGEVRATAPYTSAEFVVDYVGTELQVTALLLVATAWWWPWRALGLRRPQAPQGWGLAPLALLVAGALAARGWAVAHLPAGAAVDAATGWRVLRTTLVVGLNEEWLFRGLALVAFCHWWGWRRGWQAALAAFGALHLLNLIAGVPPAGATFQFVNTVLMGSVFVLAAVATRSLLWPAIGHALYDWAVIDTMRHVQAGAPPDASSVLAVGGLLLGVASMVTLWRMAPRRPYLD